MTAVIEIGALIFVAVVMIVAIVLVLHDDRRSKPEPPTLDVQNHQGDPNDPTAGTH